MLARVGTLLFRARLRFLPLCHESSRVGCEVLSEPVAKKRLPEPLKRLLHIARRGA
jgi:hypothetical protein